MKPINELERQLVEYISNEMSPSEKAAFQVKLNNDPALLKEFEELQKIRGNLLKWKEEKVLAPSIDSIVNDKSLSNEKKHIVQMAPWMKVAAVIFLFFFSAWLFNVEITQVEKGLTLRFGGPQAQNHPVQQVAVDGAISSTSEFNKQKLIAEVLDTMVANQDRFLTSWSNDFMTILQAILDDGEKRQSTKIEEVVARVQKQDVDQRHEELTNLMNLWESRRQGDLQNIELAFLRIAEALSQQQYETEELLSSIFYNTPTKNY